MESVDTRDLKSLARMSMRVRVPPVLPPKEYDQDYQSEQFYLDNLEVYVYNHKGKITNIKSMWK